MLYFAYYPKVYQNRLGELVVVTGADETGSFYFRTTNHNDFRWYYVCDL